MCSRHGWHGCFISYTYTGLHLEIDPRGGEMSIYGEALCTCMETILVASLIASTNIVISCKRKELGGSIGVTRSYSSSLFLCALDVYISIVHYI